jgi:outer membrane protein assembly factor BamB
LVSVFAVRGADWPQWRGPDRSDVSKETGLLASWPEEGPKLLWTCTEAGIGHSGPAIVGDRLYSMGADDKLEYLFALDVNTGKKLWSTEIGPLMVNAWGDGPRGTPTVDGDRIFALGGKGDLVCVEKESGKKLWSKNLERDLSGKLPFWGYTESVLADGDKVICTPGGEKGTLAALDKKSGEVVWRSTDLKDSAMYSSPIRVEVAGTPQYVVMTGQSVSGVAADDGKLLWSYERKGPTAAIPTPISHDNFVYATSGYSAGCNLIRLIGNNRASLKFEEVYKNKDMTNHHGGVLLVGDYIYGHSDNKGWMCQEFKTGKPMWEEKKFPKGCLTYADGHLYCYSQDDGTVVLVEASPSGWKESGRFKIPQQTKVARKQGQIWTHPVVANGRLYLRDQDLIFCYDVKAPTNGGR